jgi:hypothetical protein
MFCAYGGGVCTYILWPGYGGGGAGGCGVVVLLERLGGGGS